MQLQLFAELGDPQFVVLPPKLFEDIERVGNGLDDIVRLVTTHHGILPLRGIRIETNKTMLHIFSDADTVNSKMGMGVPFGKETGVETPRCGRNSANGLSLFVVFPGGISSANPDYLPFGFIDSSRARIRVVSIFRESR